MRERFMQLTSTGDGEQTASLGRHQATLTNYKQNICVAVSNTVIVLGSSFACLLAY